MRIDALEATKSCRVAVVEDHEIAREGIRRIIANEEGLELVAEAEGAEEAIALVLRHRPDVLILDIQLRQGTGIDVCRALGALDVDTRVLVLTGHDDLGYFRALFKLGASGFLLKSAAAREVRRAIHDVAEGRTIFPPGLVEQLRGLVADSVTPPIDSPKHPEITAREMEVLEHMSRGLRNAQLAEVMGISHRTVETHVHHVLLKLGVNSRTQAVARAIKSGWC